MGLLDTVKKVAEQTGQAGAPAAFLFGTVTSAAPLVIRVDNRFDIGAKQVVLMKEFRSGSYLTHKHTTEGGGPDTDSEAYFGLAAGDKVVLLRNQGGQEFLVLGRV